MIRAVSIGVDPSPLIGVQGRPLSLPETRGSSFGADQSVRRWPIHTLGHLLLVAAEPATHPSVDRQITLLGFRLLTICDVSVKHSAR